MHWDIFCRVIDNHGDLAVCWRLACNLVSRGKRVRLWVDDPTALAWLAPGGQAGVCVVDWSNAAEMATAVQAAPVPDVLIEAFGCDPEPALVARFAASVHAHVHADAMTPAARWLNLEYLSAEPYVERLHLLPSPVFRGPGEGLTKRFFYPGFSARTGGLLREADLMARRAAFDRSAWLAAQGIEWHGERLVSLFCYEPASLPFLLAQWAEGPEATHLLVTAGRATPAVETALAAMDGASRAGSGNLRVTFLPLLAQTAFDELLWSCDLNFVRGEDSIVRALWAGVAFVWQIYPQDDDAHHVKLNAFLDTIGASAPWRALHHAWNDCSDAAPVAPDTATLRSWSAAALRVRDGLLAQDDLTTQLLRVVDTATVGAKESR